MTDSRRIGVLTPSSNTVLEPLTSAMVAELGEVSAHFGRFRVTEISTRPESDAQFSVEAQLAAAELLADAEVDSIVWSGTSASWLGIATDQAMCAAITARTGRPAGSAVLAIDDLCERLGVRRYGLVTPYVGEIQDRIVARYADMGLTCVAERHSGETRNYAFAEIPEDTVARMIRDVASEGPDAVIVMCTNMRGARIAPRLEEDLGVTLLDSTAAALWSGLRLAGVSSRRVKGWGRLFAC